MAREKLVFHNLRFIVYRFKQDYFKNLIRTSSVESADLIQYGVEGLMQAIDSYALDQKEFEPVRIVTYAGGRNGGITRNAVKGVRKYEHDIILPAHIHVRLSNLFLTRNRLWTELGREPDSYEIAQSLDVDIDVVEDLFKWSYYRQLMRLSYQYSAPDGEASRYLARLITKATGGESAKEDEDVELISDYSWEDLLRSDVHGMDPVQQGIDAVSSVEETIIAGADRESLMDAVESLPEREGEVLKLRYGLLDDIQRTLEETGRYFGLTGGRIRQIEERALQQLRHPTRADPLKLHDEVPIRRRIAGRSNSIARTAANRRLMNEAGKKREASERYRSLSLRLSLSDNLDQILQNILEENSIDLSELKQLAQSEDSATERGRKIQNHGELALLEDVEFDKVRLFGDDSKYFAVRTQLEELWQAKGGKRELFKRYRERNKMLLWYSPDEKLAPLRGYPTLYESLKRYHEQITSREEVQKTLEEKAARSERIAFEKEKRELYLPLIIIGLMEPWKLQKIINARVRKLKSKDRHGFSKSPEEIRAIYKQLGRYQPKRSKAARSVPEKRK